MQKSNPKKLKKHSQDDEPRTSVAAQTISGTLRQISRLGLLV
jgi:hypothetical protein